ncbi:CHAT domain-containing protein [Variovorax rhizosphaerae]|uniref:CHAT domain-containing protein n=1 Tax=Variovorax rhizosphaerae TaxID=1836200 RepID=A0ABU8WPG6_9BURK
MVATALLGMPWATAQTPRQQPARDAEAIAAQQEKARLADTDTILALSNDGAVLYANDNIKLSGYQYCSQAVALADKGEFRQSVRAASKALHLAQATNNPDLQAMANRDLAIVYSYSGQLDKAEEFARESLRYESRDPKLVVGPAHKVIGDVQTRRGSYSAAVGSYETALANSSERYAPLVQSSLVNALIESGDTARARQLFDQLTPPADPQLAAQVERTRARLLLAEKKPDEAVALYRQLTTRPVGTDSGYYQLWAWDGVARAEQARGDKAAASVAVGKALASVDGVRSKFRSEEFKMGLFSDLQQVFERGVNIYSDVGDTRAAFEVSERSRSRALLDAVRGRARVSDEATATADLPTLQRALKPDERVVEFHSLRDRLQVWVVGPNEIKSFSVAVTRDELNELVDGFRNQVLRARRNTVVNAEKLGTALLAPLNLPPGVRLIFVPHGPLHYLPFQALRLNNQYVIETHPVSVAPSMSIAVQLAQSTPPRVDAQLTAFGNPRIDDQHELPGAAAEVKVIAAAFPRNNVYMGSAATKTQFREAAGRSPLIHVAAHAEADQIDPLYSRILLANEGGKQNFLEAHEILDLPLQRSALVTLSACESGLGRVATGDEVLGFTRSFLSAGTSSLISSLWSVSDDATEVLMTALYAELAKGRDIQHAMQAGQLAVLKNPSMSHPFFWAPFNLIGNWRLTVGS